MLKRGANHIEFIISSVMFIGFVVFISFLFSPISTTDLEDSSLSFALSVLVRNASVNLDSYYVVLDNSQDLPKVIDIEILDVSENKKVRVENYSGTVLPSKRDGDLVSVEWSDELTENNLIIVMFSDDFSDSISPSIEGIHDENFYRVISFDERRLISESRIESLSEKYDSDYENLKTLRFDIAPNKDFSFFLESPGGVYIDRRLEEIPKGLNLYSNSGRAEILRKDGMREFGEIGVNTW
jgi:hypothetical protein